MYDAVDLLILCVAKNVWFMSNQWNALSNILTVPTVHKKHIPDIFERY